MTTPKQIAANQRNALKSTGPRTPDGKARSRCNAVRHGLTTETVIASLEDADDYQAFEATVIGDYDAQTSVERELVLRLASALWRLRRATAIETALFESVNVEAGKYEPPYSGPALIANPDISGKHQWQPAPSSDTAVKYDPELDQKKNIGDAFLKLMTLPTLPLDRLSRYEHLLWRQARQLILVLESLQSRKQKPKRSFPFSFR